MLLKKDIELTSPLTADEIKINIQKLTRQYSPYSISKDTHCKFEGQINETGFKIYPIFNYGHRGLFRPEIIGEFRFHEKLNIVFLKFGISRDFKILFLLVLIFNISVTLFLIIFPRPTEIPLFIWDKWWLIIIALIGFYINLQLFFNFKVSKSIRIFKNALKTV